MKDNFKKIWNSPEVKYYVPVVLLILSVVAALIFYKGNLFNGMNSLFESLIEFGIPYILFAIGAGIVLSTGGVDVSFIGVATISSILAAITFSVLKEFCPIWLAIICSIIVALIIGVLSGWIVGKLVSIFNAPSLIVSWAIGSIWYTLGYVISKNLNIDSVSSSHNGITVDDFIKFMDYPFTLVFVLFALVHILNYAGITKKTMAVGANRDSATYSGVDVKKIELLSYIISGAFASLAGVIWMSTMNSAQVNQFRGEEILIIAIVVLGGTVMSGGFIRLWSVVFSAMFCVILNKTFIALHIGGDDGEQYIQIILAATFILITFLLGKKINGSTTSVQIDRNTKN